MVFVLFKYVFVLRHMQILVSGGTALNLVGRSVGQALAGCCSVRGSVSLVGLPFSSGFPCFSLSYFDVVHAPGAGSIKHLGLFLSVSIRRSPHAEHLNRSHSSGSRDARIASSRNRFSSAPSRQSPEQHSITSAHHVVQQARSGKLPHGQLRNSHIRLGSMRTPLCRKPLRTFH